MTAPHRIARAVLVLVVAALATLGGLRPAGAEAPYGYTTDRLEAAAWWLNSELDRTTATAGKGQPVDVGLTLDHVLALLALGYERDAVDRVLDAIEPQVAGGYVMPGGTAVSGALGKTLTTVLAAGRGSRYGGLDLEAELRANMVTEGRRAGEFPNLRGGLNGQGFTQSWAIMALARTPGRVPTQAVDWLLQMQCPNGGFRSAYPSRPSDPCRPDGHVDHTALAIQALLAQPDRGPAVATAIERAAAWLESEQKADGAFDDNDRNPSNTNSTGLAAQALRAAGHTSAADRARGWVEERQIWCIPDKANRGAFTYSLPGSTLGLNGVRATPQAVLALGLPAYGAVGAGGATEADLLYCPTEDGEPPVKPPVVVEGPDTDPVPEPEDPDPDPDPRPEPPGGGDGTGAGGGGRTGSGSGGRGVAGDEGPIGTAGRSGDPTPDGGPALSIFGDPESDPEPDSDVQAPRARGSERADAPLDVAGVSRRPFDPTIEPNPSPVGPTVVAAGLGIGVIILVGARAGGLTLKRRKLPVAAPAMGSIAGDTDTRTADLPAGPYG